MADSKSTNSTLELKVPTFIPLSEAADKYNLSKNVLTQLILTGKIEAVRLPSGELLVAAEKNGHEIRTKNELITKKFSHLRGQKISASEASRKYSEQHGTPIPYQNFSRWAKAGYIEIKNQGYRLQLDEADVAYCAEIYAEKYREYNGQMRGVTIFDENGNPYQIKYQEVAEQKRSKRRNASGIRSE